MSDRDALGEFLNQHFPGWYNHWYWGQGFLIAASVLPIILCAVFIHEVVLR